MRHGDEGAHAGDTHRDQVLLKRVMQLAAQPAVAHITRQVIDVSTDQSYARGC
ncbi:MAG: hypothetical protein ACLTYW_05865 [Collinsella sp.]